MFKTQQARLRQTSPSYFSVPFLPFPSIATHPSEKSLRRYHLTGVYYGWKILYFYIFKSIILPLPFILANFIFATRTIIVGFPLKEDPTVMMLAFTTTPWTLPS